MQENCGCPEELPPIIIEVGESEDSFMYGHDAAADANDIIDRMVSEGEANVSPEMLYCHSCRARFETRKELEEHQRECR